MTAEGSRVPASDTERTTLLYIGGTSRSGSTLLECLLATLDDVVVLGEVQHLWRRAVVENQLCACGQAFSDCPFWVEVGRRAFGGWDLVDLDHVFALMDQVDRQRRMPRTSRRHPAASVAAAAVEYSDYYRRIYDAAREITGAKVVVDSSKVPPLALTLSHNPELDLRVLHIVRDSRGVAYSWTKTVARPETRSESGETEAMPRFGVATSTAYWLSHNLWMSTLRRRGAPLVRLRYEDLVQDALSAVRDAWSELALPGSGDLPMLDARTIELHRTHSVAGNPMRFSLGRTTLRPDVAWHQQLSRRDRAVVTTLTYPVLRAMGYHAGSRG